jgi:hypothetical protein
MSNLLDFGKFLINKAVVKEVDSCLLQYVFYMCISSEDRKLGLIDFQRGTLETRTQFQPYQKISFCLRIAP